AGGGPAASLGAARASPGRGGAEAVVPPGRRPRALAPARRRLASGAAVEALVWAPLRRAAPAAVDRSGHDQPAPAVVLGRAHPGARPRRAARDLAADRAGARPGHDSRAGHP